MAALGSWLDARAHGGRWLVRIEDVDTPRCVPGAEQTILAQLAACGLASDAPVLRQSERIGRYAAALEALVARGWAYPCGCSRKDVEDAWRARGVARARHAELVYPGTCRTGLHGKAARAWRVRATPGPGDESALVVGWLDRRLGAQQQNVTRDVGDFVLKRADGLFAYQLAVVVDDAAQGITDVVRGEDLADNTPRQIHLQRVLDLPTPRYLHLPLVLGPDGQKLSKQNGAVAFDASRPLEALHAAARVLGIAPRGGDLASWLADAVAQWRARWLA